MSELTDDEIYARLEKISPFRQSRSDVEFYRFVFAAGRESMRKDAMEACEREYVDDSDAPSSSSSLKLASFNRAITACIQAMDALP